MTRYLLSNRRSLLLGTALAAFLAASGAAFAGPVRGRINGQEKLVPDVYAEAAKTDAHRYTWREPSPTVKQEFRVLSGNPLREICVAAIAGQQQPAHEPAHLIKITGGRTIPATIAIANGTRLAFKNYDPFPHRLYIKDSPTFKPETTNPNGQREFALPTGGGRFEVRDELFPSLRTFIVVDQFVADIAYPGRDGAFELNLGPGDYLLKAYFNGRIVGQSSVSVKDKSTITLKDPFNLAEQAATPAPGAPQK
jgi:hypothetical protein